MLKWLVTFDVLLGAVELKKSGDEGSEAEPELLPLLPELENTVFT